MIDPNVLPHEIESQRQHVADELAAEDGPEWTDKFRPGTVGCHELLDRTSLFSQWLERDLLGHPACVANAEWYALAEQASAALRELYQRVGAEHLSPEPPAED